jgi:probable HAF family extracellular repeat protein
MKSRNLRLCTFAVFVALTVSIGLAQTQQPENNAPHHPPHYTAIDLGTLGGTFGGAEGINSLGWAGGYAALTGNTNQHAVVWLLGSKIDLGTFGGQNSFLDFAPNDSGQATGEAETAVPDPLGQDWCAFGTHLTCLPFFWQFGIKFRLPTLGGYDGEGFDINSSGQVVGVAATAFHDPTCLVDGQPVLPYYQVQQFLPVVWENGRIKALPTFPGDPDGYAFANNDRGQVVGGSGNCSTNMSAHALLWQNGTVTNLGSLGGQMNNEPENINNLGEVVGFSDLPGDTTFHAFLWTKKTGIQDLGTLRGDVLSYAFGINNLGQVVGGSCDASGICRAFLWQDGRMTDLNTLLSPNAPLYLVYAYDINDRGEIVGEAYQQSTGDNPPFLAIPGPDGGDSEAAASAAQVNPVPKVTLPENVPNLVQHRLGRGRLGAGALSKPQ